EFSTSALMGCDKSVECSADAATPASESTDEDAECNRARDLDHSTEQDGVDRIVMISYHIFRDQYQAEELAEQAKSFGKYVISEDGQAAAEESAGSAPISDTIREEGNERIDAITAG